MSAYLNILADIKSHMENVTGIGQVHDYERWNNDPARFIALFSYTPAGGQKQVRGWEITRFAVTEHQKGAWWRHHRFRIRGYMGLQDDAATDKTFQVLIDAVCDELRAAANGATWYYMDGDNPENAPAQVEVIEPRIFGSVLCHCAQIALAVTERIVA